MGMDRALLYVQRRRSDGCCLALQRVDEAAQQVHDVGNPDGAGSAHDFCGAKIEAGDFQEAVEVALTAAESSGGLVDPTVGRALRLAGEAPPRRHMGYASTNPGSSII